MRCIVSVLLLAGSSLAPIPAAAQAQDAAALQNRLADLQAEIARLSARVLELEAKVQSVDSAAAPSPPPAASSHDPAPASPASVAWKGAPEITAPGGWSFKPRGRVQIDAASVTAPEEIATDGSLGTTTEFRRAYLGMEGSLPGGFGYRFEADFAPASVELTDAYLTYDASDEITLTLGHHKIFGGLEELTSDLFTSMLERAAFTSAFGFERRVGFGGVYAGEDLIVQLGVFTDDLAALGDEGNDSYSINGRVVFAPRVAGGILHLGASAHHRELNDAAATVRYRARPFTHTTDVRLVDTGAFPATGERNVGGELAFIRGPFHATLEGHRMTALRPGLPDPSFWGGYAEVGLVVTPGDKTAYKNGAYDRIRPVSPIDQGGIGAIQLNARYDRLDLTDGAIVGGTQQTAALSVIWIPIDRVRFLANYGRLWISDAAVPAGADANYAVDTLGVRAQFDF